MKIKDLKTMKTFKREIDEPMLEIGYDQFSDNPRIDGETLGWFITCESDYYSPDKFPELKDWIKRTSEEVNNADEHIEEIKKFFEENDEKVLAIYPVNKYEHSGVSYSLGEKHGFDYSNCGFYIVTTDTIKAYGLKKSELKKRQIEAIIKVELEDYNHYANGEVYTFTLYDENGEILEQGGNIRGDFDDVLEEIRGYLGKEWENEDMNDYFND